MLLPPLLRGLQGVPRASHQPPTLDDGGSKFEIGKVAVIKYLHRFMNWRDAKEDMILGSAGQPKERNHETMQT